jgi:hypothetical protein
VDAGPFVSVQESLVSDKRPTEAAQPEAPPTAIASTFSCDIAHAVVVNCTAGVASLEALEAAGRTLGVPGAQKMCRHFRTAAPKF